jgi:hypothetical protein
MPMHLRQTKIMPSALNAKSIYLIDLIGIISLVPFWFPLVRPIPLVDAGYLPLNITFCIKNLLACKALHPVADR